MTRQRRQRPLDVVGLHRFQDLPVLFLGLLPDEGHVNPDVAVHLLAQEGDLVQGLGAVGGVVQQVVEDEVLLPPEDAVHLPLHLVQHCPGLQDRRRLDVGEGDAQDGDFERRDHLVDLLHLRKGQARDHGAAPPAKVHEPLHLEQAQGLSKGDWADLQALRQLALMQGLSLRKGPPIDRLPQDVRDIIRGRVVLQVYWN